MIQKILAGFVIAGVMCFGAVLDTTAEGELIGSRSEPTRLIVGGSYGTDADTLTFGWMITFDAGLWHYEYTIRGASQPDISHFIISLSEDCTSATVGCVLNYDGPAGTPQQEYGTFDLGPENPGFPAAASIQGIKFNTTDPGDPFTVSFDSLRAPVYGHVYGKGGSTSFFYNAGLATPSDNILDYIARPNGAKPPDDEPIPEPATFGLIGLGAIALGLYHRNR